MSDRLPFQGFSTTVASSGTAVALNPQPYANTHTVLIYNPTANNVFVRWANGTGAITIANGVQIPASGSVSLVIGPASERPADGTNGTLYADASAGSTAFNVTYINGVTF